MFNWITRWFPKKSQSLMSASDSAFNNSAIPASIKIAKKPNDLPAYQMVISDSVQNSRKKRKGVIVFVSDAIASQILVIKTGSHSASILISTALYGHQEQSSTVVKIRSTLEVEKYSNINVLWVEPSLVESLNILAPNSGKTSVADTVNDFKAKANQSTNRKQFVKLVETCVRLGASDLHVEVKSKFAIVRYTIDSILHNSPDFPDGIMVKEIAYAAIAHTFLIDLDEGSNSSTHFDDQQVHTGTASVEVDGKEYKLRLTSFPTVEGNDLVARIAPAGEANEADYGSLDDSGYSNDQLETLRSHIPRRGGITLFVGIPNSGKTTSLIRSLLDIPRRSEKKFVSVEDPVEYVLPFQSSTTVQESIDDKEARRKAYEKSNTALLRANPHIMNTGEIRDDVSAESAFAAAQIGCNVFGTMHVGSAIGAWPRFTTSPINLDIRTVTLPDIIKQVVFQTLLPTVCPDCKVPFKDAPEEKRAQMTRIGKRFNVDVTNTNFYGHDPECKTCNGFGHKKQTMAAEIVVPNDEFNQAMRDGDIYEAKRLWLAESDGKWDSDNMRGKPVFAHAFKKLLDGMIDISEIIPLGNPESYDVGIFESAKFRGGEKIAANQQKERIAL